MYATDSEFDEDEDGFLKRKTIRIYDVKYKFPSTSEEKEIIKKMSSADQKTK